MDDFPVKICHVCKCGNEVLLEKADYIYEAYDWHPSLVGKFRTEKDAFLYAFYYMPAYEICLTVERRIVQLT